MFSRPARSGKGPGSILVIQTAKIGDMICTTPVFREIKKAFPRARLGVVADPVSVPILRHNPHVDEIIEFRKEWRKGLRGKLAYAEALRAREYDSALILMPNAANLLAAFWACIPRLVSIYPDFAGATVKRLLSFCGEVEYHERPFMAMETYLKSLRHFGVKSYEMSKEVYSSPNADSSPYFKGGGPTAGVILGTGNDLKDWGLDNFVELVKMVFEKTEAKAIFLLGSEKEKDKGDALIDRAGVSGRIVNLCGRFRLEDMPDVVKRLDLVIGVDTGLTYMADALEVPVIDIAGPCDMEDQRPVGEAAFVIQKKGEVSCVPCSHTFSAPYDCRWGHRRCITEITPEEVFRAFVRVIPKKAVDK